MLTPAYTKQFQKDLEKVQRREKEVSLMDNALLEKAIELPLNERVAFAELILASIDYEEEKIRQSWIGEVNNRIKAVNEGKTKLLDFEGLYNDD